MQLKHKESERLILVDKLLFHLTNSLIQDDNVVSFLILLKGSIKLLQFLKIYFKIETPVKQESSYAL